MSNISYVIDPWETGTISKDFLWGLSLSLNYIGGIIGLIAIYGIWRSYEKNSNDIFISSYCLGCVVLSISCAIQCQTNLLEEQNRFMGGDYWCTVQALIHVSAIAVQFLSVSAVALRLYLLIMHRAVIKNIKAIQACIIFWVIGTGYTIAIGTRSDAVLMPSGTYCFYNFTSPVIMTWLLPLLCISISCVTYCYIKILLVNNRSIKESNKNVDAKRYAQTQKLTRRVVLYIFVLVSGWVMIFIVAIYELITGTSSQEFDIVFAIMASVHSTAVPIAYGLFHSELIKKWLARYCISQFPQYELKWSVERRRQTIVEHRSIHATDFKSRRPVSSNRSRSVATPIESSQVSDYKCSYASPRSGSKLEVPASQQPHTKGNYLMTPSSKHSRHKHVILTTPEQSPRSSLSSKLEVNDDKEAKVQRKRRKRVQWKARSLHIENFDQATLYLDQKLSINVIEPALPNQVPEPEMYVISICESPSSSPSQSHQSTILEPDG